MFSFLIYCLLFPIKVDSNLWDGYHRQLDDDLPPINWKDCGVSARNYDPSPDPMVTTRIVGGVLAETGEFPWYALVDVKALDKEVSCGGSIINEWWILTAAHCVGRESIQKIIVSVGSVHRELIGDGRRIDVKRVVVRERYFEYLRLQTGFKKLKGELIQWERSGKDLTEEFRAKYSIYERDVYQHWNSNPDNVRTGIKDPSLFYDIALLELSERIVPVFNDSHYLINSICLPKTNITNHLEKENLVIIGMGLESLESGQPSSRLKKGIAVLESPIQCDYAIDYREYDHELKPMVCTKRVFQLFYKPARPLRPIDNASPCSGDSGGPTHQYYGSKAVQIGLHSFVHNQRGECGATGYESRVSLHMPWIRSHVLKREVFKSVKHFETIEAKVNHLLIVCVITASVIAVVVCFALLWILVKNLKTRQ